MKPLIEPDRWRKLLSSELPGEKAQLLMAPDFRGAFEHASDPVMAAVLILMYPSGGKVKLALIKRNEYDGPHSAQVSLPGGMWEEDDPSLEYTALRETREELGIVDEIEIFGSLTGLHIPVSNFMVTPFVGFLGQQVHFNPDLSEVQYVIEADLATLMDPGTRRSDTEFMHGHSIQVPYYAVLGEKIWGATAMIISEFLQLVSMQQ